MKELLEQVSVLESKADVNAEDEQSCLVSSEQVDKALKQLYDLKLEDSLGTEVISNLMDPQSNQIKYVFI